MTDGWRLHYGCRAAEARTNGIAIHNVPDTAYLMRDSFLGPAWTWTTPRYKDGKYEGEDAHFSGCQFTIEDRRVRDRRRR